MQQNKKERGKVLLLTLLGICWVAGILMAGSENAFMPWLNLSGLLLNGLASYLLCKIPFLKNFSEC
jgi:hypothetical protein